MHEPIKDRHLQPVKELLETNKAVIGLKSKRDKHEIAIKNIQNLIKQLKANRKKSIQQVVGGNLVVDLDNQKAIKMLQDKKRELEIGLKAVDEQLMHRNDGFEAAMIKTYKLLKRKLPEDVLEDES